MGKWEMVRLGDVATYVNGYAFKPSDWEDSGLQIIRIQDLTGNSYTTNYYNGQYKEKYKVKDGDVLISWSASLGVYEWNNGDALLNQHIFKVVFDKIKVDKRYFMFAVHFLLAEMGKETHGSTMKHITKPRFDNTQFPLPPLNEQKCIAKNLDLASEIVKGYKEQLAELDKLVQSVFCEMFGDPVTNEKGWAVKRLDDEIDILTGFPFESKGYSDSGIKICGGLIIAPSGINWRDCKYWKNANGYKDFLLKKNDIVMALDRPWISEGFKIAIIKENELPSLIIQRTARIRSSAINYYYLFYSFSNIHFYNHCNITGSLVPHISKKDIVSFKIPIPPLTLQTRFASIVTEIEAQKAQVQQALTEAENLFNSLMQEYFE